MLRSSIFFLLFALSGIMQAQQMYVVDPLGNDTNAGTAAAPFEHIQYAVNYSANGDTILAKPGTYHEKIDFQTKTLVLASNFIFDGLTSTIASTVINGSQDNTSNTGVKMVGQTDTCYLIGLTINSVFGSFGGGVTAISKAVTEHCIISNCTSNGEGAGYYGSGVIRNVEFRDNAIGNRGIISVVGNLKISKSKFIDNSGIAIYAWGNHLSIDNSLFVGNTGLYAGAIYMTRSGTVDVLNCTFHNTSGSNFASIYLTSETGNATNGTTINLINSIVWNTDSTYATIQTGNPQYFGPANAAVDQTINV